MNYSNGTFNIQGVDVKSITERFGTPIYIYDSDIISSQVKRLKSAFSSAPVKIKYAAKALTNISILKLIKKLGAEIEVVSLQEARLALRAGFLSTEITFTPSGVDFSEIEEAISLGLGINLDNLSSLKKLGEKYGSRYGCGLRLNPNIMAGGNLKISTGHKHSKFGIPIDQLPQIKEIVSTYDIPVLGLHIHTGSEITDPEVYLKMADILYETSKSFTHLKFLDFGSGFKVAYKEGDKVTDIEALGQKLSQSFNNFCERSGRKLELWIEPGKFIVSDAGVLVVQVNVVKKSSEITFVGVNSGLNHLIRPMMYDAYHNIVNISNPQGTLMKYNVVGYICETDNFGTDRELNEVREGDLLALMNAGAYGFSMSSNYNSRLRPAEVLVNQGKAYLIREREQFEDLLKGQIEIDL
jgi:diaminopimelate decarboxylase